MKYQSVCLVCRVRSGMCAGCTKPICTPPNIHLSPPNMPRTLSSPVDGSLHKLTVNWAVTTLDRCFRFVCHTRCSRFLGLIFQEDVDVLLQEPCQCGPGTCARCGCSWPSPPGCFVPPHTSTHERPTAGMAVTAVTGRSDRGHSVSSM